MLGIVVLGARIHTACLARRVEAAARLYHRAGGECLVVASGGRRWGEVAEAEVMADALAERGVPRGVLVRELLSMSTRENARYTTALLLRRGISRATIVTCAWHLPRALACFAREGLEVRGEPVEDPTANVIQKLYRYCRERVAARLEP
jgi:uncharacterized SAM-binding protein YcdF (DUF218 family)